MDKSYNKLNKISVQKLRQNEILRNLSLQIKNIISYEDEIIRSLQQNIDMLDKTQKPIAFDCKGENKALIIVYMLFFFNQQHQILQKYLAKYRSKILDKETLKMLKTFRTITNQNFSHFLPYPIIQNQGQNENYIKSIQYPLCKSFNKNYDSFNLNYDLISMVFDNLLNQNTRQSTNAIMLDLINKNIQYLNSEKQKFSNKKIQLKVIYKNTLLNPQIQPQIKIYEMKLPFPFSQILMIVSKSYPNTKKQLLSTQNIQNIKFNQNSQKQYINSISNRNYSNSCQIQTEFCMIYIFPNQLGRKCFLYSLEKTHKQNENPQSKNLIHKILHKNLCLQQKNFCKNSKQLKQIKRKQINQNQQQNINCKHQRRIEVINKCQSSNAQYFDPNQQTNFSHKSINLYVYISICLIASILISLTAYILDYYTNHQPIQFLRQLNNCIIDGIVIEFKLLLKSACNRC